MQRGSSSDTRWKEASVWHIRPAPAVSTSQNQPAVSVSCFRARSLGLRHLVRCATFWIKLPRPPKLDKKHRGRSPSIREFNLNTIKSGVRDKETAPRLRGVNEPEWSSWDEIGKSGNRSRNFEGMGILFYHCMSYVPRHVDVYE
jgi:hypothetical protein